MSRIIFSVDVFTRTRSIAFVLTLKFQTAKIQAQVIVQLGVNIVVVLTISILIQVLGLQPYMTANGINYRSLLVFCALFGFGGSFIPLQLSRWMAKRALGVVVLDPRRPGGDFEARYVETVSRI